MNNTRMLLRMKSNIDIQQVREAIRLVEPSERMLVIAEALMDLRDGEVEYQSCGCYDWDITMDYRNAEDRK